MDKTKIGMMIIIVSGIIFLLGIFRKNNSFVDLRSVFVEHFSMFRHSKIQFGIVYVDTIFMAIGISLIYVADSTLYQNIIVVMSIFVSMLISMLGLIKSKDFSKYTKEQQSRIRQVVDETDNEVMYCTFICLLIIMLSLIMIALSTLNIQCILWIMSAVVYYLIELLLFNILIVVKRVGKII